MVSPTRTDSLYEQVQPFTTVAKNRFVEWFCGNEIRTDTWNKNDIRGGAGTFAMSDSKDGGFKITSGSSANSQSRIDFGNINTYAHNASVNLSVTYREYGTTGIIRCGFKKGTDEAVNHGAFYQNSADDTYYRLFTQDGSSGNSVNTSVKSAEDTVKRLHKIECKSSSVDYTIAHQGAINEVEGWYGSALTVTSTSNLPSQAMQPMFSMYGNSVARVGHILYMEAYNT